MSTCQLFLLLAKNIKNPSPARSIITHMKNLKSTTQRDYARRMLDVIAYIQSHLDEDIQLEQLAGVACFSSYHFHRIFTGMMGQTLKKYIRQLKLQRAAEDLIKTDRSVLDIALDAGYETHESFTRAFGAMFGIAPQQFRNDNPSLNTLFSAKANVLKQLNENSGDNDMNVEIVEFPQTKVAFVRHTGPYKDCGKAWETLCNWAGPNGMLQPGCTFFGLCHDDPDVTDPDKIRYDACISIDTDCQTEGQIQIKSIQAGPYAKTTHFGPYDNLSKTYAKLCGQWIPEKGYEPDSKPSIEIYLNSPEDTDPKDLITDVYVPLVKE